MKILKIKRAWRIYVSGDIGGFNDDVAERLINAGIAEIFNDGKSQGEEIPPVDPPVDLPDGKQRAMRGRPPNTP